MFTITVKESGYELCTVEVLNDVCRVGSLQPEGIQIDGLEPHALTIQQRRDGFRVYNRCSRDLQLHRRKFGAGESKTWKPGQVLSISPVQLVLDTVDGKQEHVTPIADQPSTKSNTDSSFSSVTDRMPALIGLLLLGLFLIMRSGTGNAHADKVFCGIVQRLQSAPHDSRLATVKSNLQTAYDYQSRGESALAADHYKEIRRILLSKRSQYDSLRFEQSIRDLETETLMFVGRCLVNL